MVVERRQVIGAETRVFAQHGTSGVRFTLREPWTTLILDDERVVHKTTAIRPADGPGPRDTLVLTFRRGGFQDPPVGVGSSCRRPWRSYFDDAFALPLALPVWGKPLARR
jgi:hypothetical protein